MSNQDNCGICKKPLSECVIGESGGMSAIIPPITACTSQKLVQEASPATSEKLISMSTPGGPGHEWVRDRMESAPAKDAEYDSLEQRKKAFANEVEEKAREVWSRKHDQHVRDNAPNEKCPFCIQMSSIEQVSLKYSGERPDKFVFETTATAQKPIEEVTIGSPNIETLKFPNGVKHPVDPRSDKPKTINLMDHIKTASGKPVQVMTPQALYQMYENEKKKVEELTETLRITAHKLADKNELLDVAKNEIAQLKGEYATLQDQYRSASTEINRKNGEIRDLTRAEKILLDKVKNLDISCKAYCNELEAVRNDLESTERRNTELVRSNRNNDAIYACGHHKGRRSMDKWVLVAMLIGAVVAMIGLSPALIR